jgi:hypothetical protein
VTLAELRETLQRELIVQALQGAGRLEGRLRVLGKVGRPLVLAHVKPRATFIWDGRAVVVEKAESDQVLFHWPREIATMREFLEAVLAGKLRDV